MILIGASLAVDTALKSPLAAVTYGGKRSEQIAGAAVPLHVRFLRQSGADEVRDLARCYQRRTGRLRYQSAPG